MSISSNSKSGAVLVRAYGDEPVRLYAVGTVRNGIEVIGAEPDKSIGFPIQYVFEFEDDLFSALREAYEKNERAQLLDLWSRARRYQT